MWKINIVCSNILTSHAYGIHIVQLIWYSWACVSYQNIIERLMLLTRTLLNHWFLELKLKSVTAYSSGASVFPSRRAVGSNSSVFCFLQRLFRRQLFGLSSPLLWQLHCRPAYLRILIIFKLFLIRIFQFIICYSHNSKRSYTIY